MRAVVTVVGKDKTGIIAKVSTFLAEKGVNILDISQTILQDYFTMIMLMPIFSPISALSVASTESSSFAPERSTSIIIVK